MIIENIKTHLFYLNEKKIIKKIIKCEICEKKSFINFKILGELDAH